MSCRVVSCERCRAARAFAHIVNICSTQRRAVFPGSRDSLTPLPACSAARDHEAGPATDHREGLMSTAASAGASSVIDLALAEAGREHRRPFPSRPGAAWPGWASRRGPSRRPPPTPPAVRPGWSASCSVPAHGRRSSLPAGQPAAGCGRRSSPTRSGTGSACQSTPKRRPAVRRSSRAAGPGCCRKIHRPARSRMTPGMPSRAWNGQCAPAWPGSGPMTALRAAAAGRPRVPGRDVAAGLRLQVGGVVVDADDPALGGDDQPGD